MKYTRKDLPRFFLILRIALWKRAMWYPTRLGALALICSWLLFGGGSSAQIVYPGGGGTGGGGGSGSFDAITSGVNTIATMQVGPGATVTPFSTGVVNANRFNTSSIIAIADGGTNLSSAPDDNIMVGNGTTWQAKAIPDCPDSGGQHLNYVIATNTWSCGNTGGAGGGAGAFSAITTATNTTATMTCGTGCSIVPSGSGIVQATKLGTLTEADVLTPAGPAVVFNKQNVARTVLQTVASNAFTVDIDATDIAEVPVLTAGVTVNLSAGTGGNPRAFQDIAIMFRPTAAPRSIAWQAGITAHAGISLPTTTTGDNATVDWVLLRRHATLSEWVLVAKSMGTEKGVTSLSSSTTFTCDPQVAKRCEMQMTEGAGTVTIDDSAMMTPTPTNGQEVWLALQCTNLQTLVWDAGIIDGISQTKPTSCPANTSIWVEILLRYSTVESKWIVLVGAPATVATTGYIRLPVTGIKMVTSNGAPIDVSANNNFLAFDDTTSECVIWELPALADYVGSPVFKYWDTTPGDTNTGHNLAFDISVMALVTGASIETDSYASVNNCDDAAIQGTAHHIDATSCSLTNNDSLAANIPFKIKMCRDVANDNTVGDARVVRAEFSYAK